MTTTPTACMILIGNEILSGRTQDKNLGYLANELNDMGIRMMEARVIPDIESVIIDTVNECRTKFTYIFTTGGIGPTHDDITCEAIAKAFGVPVIRHPEAERRLLAHYKPEDVNEARMKMADVPEGAQLIDNPVSSAPGFYIDNVFVMAGVPRIMQAMVDFIKPLLHGGQPMRSVTLEVERPEGDLAAFITQVQESYPQIEIGVYPLIKQGMLATNIVLRGQDETILHDATNAVRRLLGEHDIIVLDAA